RIFRWARQRHIEVMSLPAVPDRGGEVDADRNGRGERGPSLAGYVAGGSARPAGVLFSWLLSGSQPQVAGALAGSTQGSGAGAERRLRRGRRRDDELIQAEFLAQRPGVGGAAAAPRDQRELARIVATLDGHRTDQVGH